MVKYTEAVKLRDMRELVERAGELYGALDAFIELDSGGNEHAYTFSQVREDVAALGTALFEKGLAGKHVAIVGEACYSWVVSYLAVVNAGGVAVPLDRELTNEDLVSLLRKGDADAVFYGDALHQEMPAILAECPLVGFSVNISRYARESHNPGFDALLELGQSVLEAGDTRFAEVVIDPHALAVIIFTSGTTGANKGVMLSHHNLMFVQWSLASITDPGMDIRRSLSLLPLHHSYGSTNFLAVLYGGTTICFNDTILHLKDNLARFRPDYVGLVPMILEGMYQTVVREAEKNNLTKALRFGLAYSNLLRKFGLDLRRTLFKPVLEHFGGNMKAIGCGGATLRPELVKWYNSLGIDIPEAYGLTECGPLVTGNSSFLYVPGSVGIPGRDIEVRIGDPDSDGNGETQVKGENVMLGYYKDPVATEQTFTEDGWLKTGDRGHLGRKGALFLTGRIKNLIVLGNGKNVSPEEVEETLQNNLPYVTELLVYEAPDTGQGARIALTVYFDPQWLDRMGAEQARAQLRADVDKVNRELTVYKRVQVLQVRDVPFEKTSTHKVKRNQQPVEVTIL